MHYFLAHLVDLVTNSNPLRYLLLGSALLDQVARWLVQLIEFNISEINPKGIRIQALLDFLAQFPSRGQEPLHEDLPYEEIHTVEPSECRLAFDAPPLFKSF